MVFVTRLTDGGLIWIIAALVLLFIPKYRRYGIALAAVLVLGALLNSFMIKPLIGRGRPFEGLEEIALLISPPADASFPSGHTLAAVSAATVLWCMDRRVGISAAVLAALTAFSRMYLYVHFPTDILAGAVFGVCLALACVWLMNKAKRGMN